MPYRIYGNYFIHLDFEVTDSLSDRTIEAGETRTITVSLDENQPERNQFFTTLYNADFSDLNFKYETSPVKSRNRPGP